MCPRFAIRKGVKVLSRLDIMTPSRAQTVIDGLYRDVERRIAASPPGLCPVDLAMNFLNLCHAQTCGKCVPCRVGLGQLSDLMESVLDGLFNYKDDTYTIINMESMTDAMNLMTSMMMSLLVGIASIALVVGGIGIMNMMLVTVTERTTEIGLRKALGAEPGQIQIQFLLEAIILSLLGGLMGVVVGLGVSYAICLNTDIAFSLNTFAIGLGVSFSAAVGIIFGWAPARKASNLNPIDALRSM